MTTYEFYKKYNYLYHFAKRKYNIDIMFSNERDPDGYYMGCARYDDGTKFYTFNSHKKRVNVLLELMAMARAKRDT